MDEAEETNRAQKLAGREKARRYRPGSRAYLHATTNARVKRAKELVSKLEDREHERAEEQGKPRRE